MVVINYLTNLQINIYYVFQELPKFNGLLMYVEQPMSSHPATSEPIEPMKRKVERVTECWCMCLKDTCRTTKVSTCPNHNR